MIGDGISRTEIAAIALQGLLAGRYTGDESVGATLAVRYADALLAELRKPGEVDKRTSDAVEGAKVLADTVLEIAALVAKRPAFHDETACARKLDAIASAVAQAAVQARLVRGR